MVGFLIPRIPLDAKDTKGQVNYLMPRISRIPNQLPRIPRIPLEYRGYQGYEKKKKPRIPITKATKDTKGEVSYLIPRLSRKVLLLGRFLLRPPHLQCSK